MRRVETGQAELGMVLAEAVRGPRGDVLLPAGVELSDRHLRGLKAWGIAAIMVSGDEPERGGADVAMPAEITPEMLAAARAEVLPRFARCGTAHPALAFLEAEATRRRAAERIAGAST